MGTLVFQATLGGAVNIIGPNIANTINFTLPSADGTSGQTWTTNGSGVLAFGTLGIAGGGTGQITATAAFNALAPSQTGNSGKYLTTDGTNTSWGTNPLGTVTSVAVSGGTTGLTTSGGPITTSGTITFAGTLATSNGGTGMGGATPFTANGVVYASSSSVMTTNSTLVFDGANLGVATTPAAWQSTFKAVQVAQGTAVYGRTNTYSQIGLSANYCFNGTNLIYVGNGFATRYEQEDGAHKFFTAPSGTAGNAISFTQAMTLDSAGSLIVGDTSVTASSEKVSIRNNSGVNLILRSTANSGMRFYSAADNASTSCQINYYSGYGFSLETISALPMVFLTTNTERLRIPAAGGVQAVTTISVGNATPSASGAGITFPATQSASSDANTLDDYEEGTWTPTIGGSTVLGTGTYTTQQGTYTKIGNSVRFQAYIEWTAHTGSGQLEVRGYPFTSTAETTPISLSFYGGPTFTLGSFIQASVNPNSTSSGTGQTSSASTFSSVAVSATGIYIVSGIYKVA